MTEVERALNRMEQVEAIIGSQQAFYQSQSGYYAQTGRLQGVIGYSQMEIGVLTAENDVLKKNIEVIEQYMKQKQKELDVTDMSSDKYEEVRDDLDKLQKAHQEYTKKLIDNGTAVDQLNEKIDEQRKKIRDMEINIRNLVYKAIEDRERKTKTMLENEISMENTILDIIKRRYEIERDLILDNTDRKITALQEERDLLSEQLAIRKEMAEAEDKAAKLAQLEANYQRIIADPTRKKEAQKIKDQIDDLRKDIAWDTAEQEVKAQQDSIDQQITSLEDYKEYVNDYYEDLFAHPAKLIEEMRNLITKTDDEIIDWLTKNSEDFAAASENTQKKMIGDWTDTLDEMHGIVKTYWAEVESIVSQGDQAIIDFLKENSEDYAKAGALQAEKYVEEWAEALEDLHKALEDAFVIEAPTYTVLDPGTSSGGSSSGGSSGGGGSTKQKSGTATAKPTEELRYYEIYDEKGFRTNYVVKGMTKTEAQNKVKSQLGSFYTASGSGYLTQPSWATKVFKKGGLATQTGLAWLDGTPSDPERILSPYQTRLFETMVQALERMSTITVPTMPNFGGFETGNNSNVSVGDIIVNVDNLDTDDDYEELAEKVSEVLMERIGRTTAVGGLRINA